MADHFALLPPESPALNGGDWLDLGTMECPDGWDLLQGPGNAPKRVHHDLSGKGDATCGGSGRVPVVPTWTCPTCEGEPECPECGDDGTNREPDWPDCHFCKGEPCEGCDGEGVVHEGWLALGAAAHECPQSKRKDHRHSLAFDGDDPYTVCVYCKERRDALTGAVIGEPTAPVPASLSELVRVQRVPVVDEAVIWRGDQPHSTYLAVPSGHIWLHEWSGYSGKLPCWSVSDITDQFPVPPNPGDLVWRIVERVTLSDPITGYPCRQPGVDMLREIARREHAECNHEMAETVTRKANEAALPERPLPQQVGWYQADDALVAEIERRKP